MLTKKTSVRIISDESHPLVIDDAQSAAGGQRRQSLQNVAKLKRVLSVGRGFRKPGAAGGANGASASSLGSGAPTSNPQSYHRISVDGVESEKDYTDSAEPIAKCLLAREQYKTIDQGEMEDSSPFDQDAAGSKQFLENIVTEQTSNLVFPMKKGVFSFEGIVTKPVEWKKYVNDVKMMFSIVENGPCLATARGRLIALEEKFELYSLMNTELEEEADRFRRGGGVYARNTRVDNNVRLATLATAPQLTEFLKSTADATPHVPFTENKSTEPYQLLSFKSTLERCGIADPQAITVEGLGLHPRLYRGRFQPFDVFQEKLNPAGQQSSDILNALVEMEAPNRGELFACLVRPMLERAEFADGQVVAYDMKLPIRGRHSEEWRNVASWVYRQGFHQFSRVMWTVDLQREEEPARLGYNCQTHADHYKHMFLPLMLATASPHDPRYSEISAMLLKVGQFNLALGTAPRQRTFFSEEVPPETMPWTEAVDDYYFCYYVWANLCVLNALRRRLGLNTFTLRVSCVQPFPNYDQLISGFLLADSIEHGLTLGKCWILQYLYLMSRIGIIMSPLCDNALRVSYFQHPFQSMFKRGLHVSLATSDPLHFHHSTSPLTEEYATMMKVGKLTPMDLCEIARNSVLISNFPKEMQRSWLGKNFQPIGSSGNEMALSSLCDFRLQFRHEVLHYEQSLVNAILQKKAKKGGPPPIQVTKVPPTGDSDISSRRGSTDDVNLTTSSSSRSSIKHRSNVDSRVVYPRFEISSQAPAKNIFVQPAASGVDALSRMLALRKKYTHTKAETVNVEDVFHSQFDESIWEYSNYYGVFLLARIGRPPPWPLYIPPVNDFINDVHFVRQTVVGNPQVIQLATHRLNVLEHKFLFHLSMNTFNEGGTMAEKEFNNRDFFTAHKVDNNVQTHSGMNARTLLDFFVEKALNNGDDVVFDEGGVPITLRQLLERLDINPHRVTVDELNHLIKANGKFRDIFLSTDNFMQGRYFAELTKRTLDIYQLDEFTFSENRLSIYGKSTDEWWNLADWFDRYGMASPQNRWMISLPRNYRKLRQAGHVKNFGEFLHNVFQPLWEISLHPVSDTKFHYFLTHVSGFDCFDDESKVDLPLSGTYPHDWSSELNPPYNLYLYYFWANIISLNEFRGSRGLGQFTFRPQCGELGSIDHLIGAFLVANSINHGVTLHKFPPLEYVYYLTQIGITMSPLSNTSQASPYLENPFPHFFNRGLNVSLSTNEPLYYHFTREPLVEEYSIALKIWKMQFNDLCEIARNSVLQSGFSPAWKEKALGRFFDLRSTLGNAVTKSRLSDIRVAYRFEVYHAEMNFLEEMLPHGQRLIRYMRPLLEEIGIVEAATKTRIIIPGVSGDGEAMDPKSVLQRLRVDMKELTSELEQDQLTEKHLFTQNTTMATKIQALRDRLKTLPLAILGNLSAMSADPQLTGRAATGQSDSDTTAGEEEEEVEYEEVEEIPFIEGGQQPASIDAKKATE